MQSFFEPLMKLLKLEKIDTDNLVFRLHYKVTVPIFILFSAMLTAKQYFGDPIECSVKGEDARIVNTYCWTHGTYTVKDFEHVTRRPPTKEEREYMEYYGHNGEIAPGIRSHDPSVNEKQYYVFYQWVCFVIFFQAMFFYLPRFCWKTFVEKGRMKFLTAGMRDMITCEENMDIRAGKLLAGFNKIRGKNDKYAYGFFLLECIHFVNVCFQFYVTNVFLHYRFWAYGPQMLQYLQNYEFDWNPMDEVFPKVAKCTFKKIGMGGEIQNLDGLCVLPLNIVNEKIYGLMWVWMMILAVASAIAIIYRMICILIPEVRTFMLWNHGNRWSTIANACRNRPYGDWFVLRQMSKNVEEDVFDRFLIKLNNDRLFGIEFKERPIDRAIRGKSIINVNNEEKRKMDTVKKSRERLDSGNGSCDTMKLDELKKSKLVGHANLHIIERNDNDDGGYDNYGLNDEERNQDSNNKHENSGHQRENV